MRRIRTQNSPCLQSDEHSNCEARAGAWPIPRQQLGWYKDAPFSLPLLFLPLHPVNQTGVKRRLISPLSGWQCLGDRPIVANRMVPLSPLLLHPPIPYFLDLDTSVLTPPLSSRLYQPFFTFFSKHSPPPSPLPCLHLSFPAPQCYPSLTHLLSSYSAHPFLFSTEWCRATRGNSLVHCSQVNWLAQRKGL